MWELGDIAIPLDSIRGIMYSTIRKRYAHTGCLNGNQNHVIVIKSSLSSNNRWRDDIMRCVICTSSKNVVSSAYLMYEKSSTTNFLKYINPNFGPKVLTEEKVNRISSCSNFQ